MGLFFFFFGGCPVLLLKGGSRTPAGGGGGTAKIVIYCVRLSNLTVALRYCIYSPNHLKFSTRGPTSEMVKSTPRYEYGQGDPWRHFGALLRQKT